MHHHIGKMGRHDEKEISISNNAGKMSQMQWHVRGGLQSQTTASDTLE